jgi:hypothetical protein
VDTNLPKKKEVSRPTTHAKDWKQSAIEAASQLLVSVPIPARVNLSSEIFLVLIFFLGGKFYQPMPPSVNAIGFLFCIVFPLVCLFYCFYLRRDRRRSR